MGKFEPLPEPGVDFGQQEEVDWITEQNELLSQMRESGTDSNTQAMVLAIMRGLFQKRFGQRGQAGQRNNYRNGPAAPPRGMQDMSCVNCGQKGHMADKCPKPKVDRVNQPCFGCGKSGHGVSRDEHH